MKEASAADNTQFKAIDGDELLIALIDHLDKALHEVLLKANGQFSQGRSYPVCSVHGALRIGLYHDPRQSQPYKVVDTPIKLWTFTQPDGEAIKGLNLVLSEEKRFSFNVGRDIESAPDAIRETHDLVVLQPQKLESGLVADAPVEQPPKPRKNGFRGAAKRIRAEIEAERQAAKVKRDAR